jgi:hypothetical protein
MDNFNVNLSLRCSPTFLQQLPTKVSQTKSRRKVGDTWAEKVSGIKKTGYFVRAKMGVEHT